VILIDAMSIETTQKCNLKGCRWKEQQKAIYPPVAKLNGGLRSCSVIPNKSRITDSYTRIIFLLKEGNKGDKTGGGEHSN